MARIRTIKPGFWTDEKLAEVPRTTRLTFAGLFSACADDLGRFKANPRVVRGMVYPLDDVVTANDIQDELEQLAKIGVIELYTVNGEMYGRILNWTKHQKIDKPMRNHTLMQTIARANRVYPGKHSGLIVDYANVFVSLEKALAIYGTGRGGGTTPVRDKAELVAALRSAMNAALAYCAAHNVDIGHIDALPAASMERLSAISDAVEQLISPDAVRKDFLERERWITTLLAAVKPDPAAIEFYSRSMALSTIAGIIRERTGGGQPADITVVMDAINKLLDESIAADGFQIHERKAGADGKYGVVDLSAIDFAALARRFEASNRKNVELEQLKAAIRNQLDRMIQVNRTRADYLEKFEALIEAYNTGSRNIDELFQELVSLSQALSDEQQRHVREHLSEPELTIFDLLTRPGPDLSAAEREEVKRVAKNVLAKVKSLVSLDWRQRVQARAQVRLAIEETLDHGLPQAYTRDVFANKAAVLFEHVFEKYGSGAVAAQWHAA